jgi:hypothetical protein
MKKIIFSSIFVALLMCLSVGAFAQQYTMADLKTCVYYENDLM